LGVSAYADVHNVALSADVTTGVIVLTDGLFTQSINWFLSSKSSLK